LTSETLVSEARGGHNGRPVDSSLPRVGHSIDDYCRACKMPRRHTVVAVAPDTGVVRVHCDYCGSQHNFRAGGGRPAAPATRAEVEAPYAEPAREWAQGEEVDLDGETFERVLRRVIREETGLTPVPLADRWRGGQLVLKPGRPGVQDKAWPIDAFFHKVVMLRNRLRVLEQQLNATELPADVKLKLQSYITGCYGTLTSFNVLFADEADRFKGASGGDD
jgi:hypothetical protein